QFVDPDGGRGVDNVDPATGRVVARVHIADENLVDRAVDAANRSLHIWSRTPVRERADVLRRAAQRIEERFAEFVAAEIADTGKPARLARELDVPRAIANFRAFADIVSAAGEEAYFTDLSSGRQALNYTVRKPLGVVAVIVPWNLPLLLLTWKVAPALACGNTVVVKPSELTPSTAVLLAEVLSEAGLPPGVY
ncbi:aldehyde dehydrogenase family protein, partial [Nocardia gipuzkoensis]